MSQEGGPGHNNFGPPVGQMKVSLRARKGLGSGPGGTALLGLRSIVIGQQRCEDLRSFFDSAIGVRGRFVL